MTLDEFLKKLESVREDLLDDVASIVAETATEYFKGSFRRKAFDGSGWKRSIKGSGSTLVQTGNLMNSIRPAEVSAQRVVISAGNEHVGYARIHNEGGEVEVTPRMRKFFWAMYYKAGKTGKVAEHWKSMALAKKITIPQRQFMGDSNEMFDMIDKRITQYIQNQLQ